MRPIDILLVEDNPADVLLAEEALADSAIPHTLRVIRNGVEALADLRASDQDSLPDLIVLDVRLPGMSGHDVLAEIKADQALGQLPVVMLSSSRAEADVRCSYERHASCYVTKPSGLDDYMAAIRAIECFWLGTVQLPGRC
jgi:CheY-like chemotaxis protein